MRTNIDIDDALMADAMAAGPYTTKKDAVEAGLKLLKRQAAYREILKWEGKLKWEGDESIDWTVPIEPTDRAAAPQEPAPAEATPAGTVKTTRAGPAQGKVRLKPKVEVQARGRR